VRVASSTLAQVCGLRHHRSGESLRWLSGWPLSGRAAPCGGGSGVARSIITSAPVHKWRKPSTKAQGSDEFEPDAETETLLIDGASGKRIGNLPYGDAKAAAEGAGLNLVWVAGGDGKPWIFKQMSPEAIEAQAKALQDKAKEAEATARKAKAERRAQGKAEAKLTKEVRLTALAGEHDIQIKVRQARKFLEKGLRVKCVVNLPGRQMGRGGKQNHRAVMDRLVDDLADLGAPASPPDILPQRITCVIAPEAAADGK